MKYGTLNFKIKLSLEECSHYKRNKYPNIYFKKAYLIGKINEKEVDFLTNYLLGFGTIIRNIDNELIKATYRDKIKILLNNI
ncbi:hypothetical protein GCM10011573_35690 [Enterococcus wangshanyuanii]|uniref:Uncharacterized protein n=1 Tax=Enterococcus wangshanyuanii TaxID=2005703 RepID=A0ABQ1PST3_9ENTE|nr:hypothetical protein GCM10011573_35690 [Enterococcus wangshanyuanii]